MIELNTETNEVGNITVKFGALEIYRFDAPSKTTNYYTGKNTRIFYNGEALTSIKSLILRIAADEAVTITVERLVESQKEYDD